MSIPIAKQYIKDFEQLGFGVFVHFGLYSVLGKGEWVAAEAKWDRDEYVKLMDRFEVDDMGNMVREIKRSGAKYITLTTRHHDGFSLFDTCGLNDFDAPHSAAGRDLVKEFVDACRENDIVPFLYHTTLEFWHPAFEKDATPEMFSEYLEYLRKSVELLCTNYGEIGGFWFDGNWSKKEPEGVWEEDKLYGMIRRLQPNAMIINNTGLGGHGKLGHPELDSVTFERGKPTPLNREGMEKYVSGEVCDSVNKHWGMADDINYKSPKYILENLCYCRGAGANYLFNVGPDGRGNIPEYPKATLGVIGRWMELFGQAIYNGRPFWHKEDVKHFVMKDDKHAYFVYFDLVRRGCANVTYNRGGSYGEFTFEDFGLDVENIRWMDNDEALNYKYDGNSITIDFTGFEYGIDYCVRIAIADIKDCKERK